MYVRMYLLLHLVVSRSMCLFTNDLFIHFSDKWHVTNEADFGLRRCCNEHLGNVNVGFSEVPAWLEQEVVLDTQAFTEAMPRHPLPLRTQREFVERICDACLVMQSVRTYSRSQKVRTTPS